MRRGEKSKVLLSLSSAIKYNEGLLRIKRKKKHKPCCLHVFIYWEIEQFALQQKWVARIAVSSGYYDQQ